MKGNRRQHAIRMRSGTKKVTRQKTKEMQLSLITERRGRAGVETPFATSPSAHRDPVSVTTLELTLVYSEQGARCVHLLLGPQR